MKIKSRVNGLIIEATTATAEILKLGNGKFAQAISDNDVESPVDVEEVTPDPDAPLQKAPARKAPAKRRTTSKQTDADKVKAEAKAKGITLTDAQIEGGNVHDDTASSEDAVEKL